MKNTDSRNIENAWNIPVDYYSDQPYVVKCKDGSLLLTVTTGAGFEGAHGQHIASMKSYDGGKTWTDKTNVESPENPESSYSVLYATKYGRIYCFYNYNADNLRSVKAEEKWWKDGKCERVDTQGHFVFKYSDDNGKSWSEKYYDIPMRKFAVDLSNPYGGEIMYFWNVGKAFSYNGGAFVPIYKIGKFGCGFMCDSECALLFCSNIETEKNPEKLTWETFPEGDNGIKADRNISNISEEHSFVVLSDNSIFTVFRTISGNPYCSYSRDGGKSFSEPCPMRYADGAKIRHPRSANFIWKCENGKYLYWFHNNGGKWYDDRNPVWLSGAVEKDGRDGKILVFSRGEIMLYHNDVNIRISYPDMIEQNGEYYLTAMEKRLAFMTKVDKTTLENLWRDASGQYEKITDFATPVVGEKLCDIKPFTVRRDDVVDTPSKATLFSFAIDFDFTADEEKILLSTMENDEGILVEYRNERVVFTMSDGRRKVLWDTDEGIILEGKENHLTIAVDGSARCICFTVNGILQDGGEASQFGFGRFDEYMLDVSGGAVKACQSGTKLFTRRISTYEAKCLYENR